MTTSEERSQSGIVRERGWEPKVLSRPSGADTPPSARPARATPPSARFADPVARALLGAVPDAVLVLRKDGTIEEYYDPKEGEFLLSSESVLGRRLKELLPSQTGQMVMHYLEKVFRTGQPQAFSFHQSVPGRMRVYEFRLAVCATAEAVALVRDVTDREFLEKEIVESSNRVQARIGQDLHDGLGQHLTGITFLSKALERKLAARSLPEAEEAAEIGRLVMGALSQTRNLAKGLFPVELQSNGLVPGLSQLAETVEDLFQICCQLSVAEGVVVNDPDASMHLFRLAQEAINNAVKHGKARSVFLTLQPEGDDRLVLRIEDDGVGIPEDRTQSRGLGLRIMNYRAQKLGGTVEIVPGPAGGTRVTCSFPLPDEMR